MNLWVMFLLVGLLTYALRLSFVFLQGRVEMPSWFPRALRFVPIAVLSALIAPELFHPGGVLDVSLGNARLLAGLLSRTAEFQVGGCPLEDRLLMIDYAIMRVWCSAARRYSHSRAQQALTEMAGIVGHFAGVVGELTAARSAARSEI